MDRSLDPRNTFAAVHQQVTAELLHLMDGFYSNIEDGLFELAFRDGDESKQRHCFELMREMRFRRTNLVKTFAKRMERGVTDWFYQAPVAADKASDTFVEQASAIHISMPCCKASPSALLTPQVRARMLQTCR
jgi:hypothetical protein